MKLIEKSEWFELGNPIGEPDIKYTEDSYIIERKETLGQIIWYGLDTNWMSLDGGYNWMKLVKNEWVKCRKPKYEIKRDSI